MEWDKEFKVKKCILEVVFFKGVEKYRMNLEEEF